MALSDLDSSDPQQVAQAVLTRALEVVLVDPLPDLDDDLPAAGLDSLRFMMVLDQLAVAGFQVDLTTALARPTRSGLLAAMTSTV